MGQVSTKLRRITGGYAHWCPACKETHRLPDGWSFDGNLESPTFSPSFKHTGLQTVVVDGRWTGEWVFGADGEALPFVCHYILTAGVLNYCSDCTHTLAGTSVQLPTLPDFLRNEDV